MAIQTTIEVLRIPGTLFPRGPFDENASYKFLNIVESGGSGYVCLQPCTGIPVTNTAYWFKFVFKGDKGDAFTYADLTAEQKAELVRDATAAAQAAASSAQSAADDAAAALQKFNTIKAAIDAIDPQSTEGSIQTLAAKQGLLEAELDALGPKIFQVAGGEMDISSQAAYNGTGYFSPRNIGDTFTGWDSSIDSSISGKYTTSPIDISAFDSLTISSDVLGNSRNVIVTDASNKVVFVHDWYDLSMSVNVKTTGGKYLYLSISNSQTVTITGVSAGLSGSVQENANNIASLNTAQSALQTTVANHQKLLVSGAYDITNELQLSSTGYYVTTGRQIGDTFAGWTSGVDSDTYGTYNASPLDISSYGRIILQANDNGGVRAVIVTDSNDKIVYLKTWSETSSTSPAYKMDIDIKGLGGKKLYVSKGSAQTLTLTAHTSGFSNEIDANKTEIAKIKQDLADKFGVSNSFAVSTTASQNLSANIDYIATKDTKLSFSYDTNLIDQNGVNVILKSGTSTIETISGVKSGIKTNVVLSSNITNIIVSRMSGGIIGTGTFNFNVDIEGNVVSEIAEQIETTIYIDPANGNDENDGKSWGTALKTLAAAMKTNGSNLTIWFTGDLDGSRINILNASKSISVLGKKGTKNRILGGTKYNSGTLYDSTANVYSISGVSSFVNVSTSSNQSYRIYQHDVNDATTEVALADRLPQQRGKLYRCDCTPLVYASSLANVLAASSPCYYYDSSNTTLYVKLVSGTTLESNPIFAPNGVSLVYGNTADANVNVRLSNFEMLYGHADLSHCCNARISDVAVKYSWSSGGFLYSHAFGITFERCEAAETYSSGSVGDGFNAHAVLTGDPFAHYCGATLIDCWSHDNHDDGYSDHERAETIIRGSLFEYNGKAGVTPAYGASCACFNVISRHNYNGFLYAGSVSDVEGEGGAGGQMLCINCVASDNGVGTSMGIGFGSNTGTGNTIVCINCLSSNNNVGYSPANGDYMLINNSASYSDTTIKGSTGTIEVQNGTIVV